MRINNPVNLTNVENKIEEVISEIRKPKWYQKWWGILILGVITSVIGAVIFYYFL
ncbi:hypothetical protein J7K86_02430 [bacterium]|nr:hypothetical protein [bacterium]